MDKTLENGQAVVIGAGPAGLTAAYELTKHGHKPKVFEKDTLVGGISRTQEYKGFHFDMGGHRFYTKSTEVKSLWREVMGDNFLVRPRLSRIYYERKFFKYPPEPIDALSGLGIFESIRIVTSYIKYQMFPNRNVQTFEDWTTNAFGKRLFQIFFKGYTEKVWGISTSELRAEWAAQRIKNLSIWTALTNALQKGTGKVKSLIEKFHYPRLGPGAMWRAFATAVEDRQGTVDMSTDVVAIHHENGKVTGITVSQNGVEARHDASMIFSSMPVTELVKKMDPPAPAEVLEAAHALKYRDFLTVCLIVDQQELFPDNWIYVHDTSVNVGRIQNFKNWSPDMVPDAAKTSLGLEYFCNEGDDLWTMSDDDLKALGAKELETIGLARADQVIDGVVYRIPKAYPVYDADYRIALDKIQGYLNTFPNMQSIGRNGLHRYNNQDHSMLTGVHAVRNMLLGQSVDVWRINGEDDYLEEELVEAEQKAGEQGDFSLQAAE